MFDKRENIILSGDQFWFRCSPSFNFQYDEDELINIGLKRGFITELKDNEKYKCYPSDQRQLKVNNNYKSKKVG
tara:strand:+ start:165 stop:386 length:222 start_codon:yes stop_codon:yes gene_type:complete